MSCAAGATEVGFRWRSSTSARAPIKSHRSLSSTFNRRSPSWGDRRRRTMRFRSLLTILAVCVAGSAQPPQGDTQPPPRRPRPIYEHPGWKPTPLQTAMPKSSLKAEEHKLQKAKFPAVDVHFHGGFLRTPADYQKLISIMDQVGLAMLVNLDGASGGAFDQYLKSSEPYKDRIITMARLNYCLL